MNAVSIVATSRYLYVSRADGSLVSRHLTIEDAIEAAVNAGVGEYRITCPDRTVKVYGVLPDPGAPGAPTALTLDEVTAGYATISWTDDGNGTSWTVYRDGVPLGNVSSTVYTDSTVAPSTLYSYQVQASNSSGSSTLSDALAVTTSANSLPAWSLFDQTGAIGQAFTLDLNTVCEDLDGHTLAFTLTSGSVPGLSLTSPSYSGTPTTVGAYALTFRANDGYGTADVSLTFNVYDPDVTAPTVPTNVSASVNGSTVTLSWTASTDARGVATYKIYRDGVFRASDTASPYIETGVPVGTYSYTVSAVDSSANDNESAQSSAALATVAPQTPDTPINFTATSDGATTINLSWAPGPNGTAPDDYDLDFSATSASGPWTAITFVGAATTYAHTGRTGGTTYYYRIRAGLGALESGYATATSGAGIHWHPGHGVRSSDDSEDSQAACISRNTAAIDFMDDSSYMDDGHAMCMVRWGRMNTTGFTYNWAIPDALLAYAKARGRRLVLMVMFKAFGNTQSAVDAITNLIPADLRAAGYQVSGPNANRYVALGEMWNATVMNRFITFLQAVATRYNDDPYFEGVTWPECATWTGNTAINPAYSTQLQRLFIASKAAFPSTNVFANLNSMRFDGNSLIPDLMEAAYDAGIGFACPDAREEAGAMVFRGLDGAVRDYRGKMPCLCVVSDSTYTFASGQSPSNPTGYIVNWLQTEGCTHHTYRKYTWWNTALASIAADPAVSTTCPLNYDGACDGS